MLAFAIGRRDFEKLLQEHEMVKKFRASEWWTTTFQVRLELLVQSFFANENFHILGSL
jgi:hypothetical protein